MCDKCKTASQIDLDNGLTVIQAHGDQFFLCGLCASILDEIGKTGFVHDFMLHDFSSREDVEFSHVSRSMLKAREKRSGAGTVT